MNQRFGKDQAEIGSPKFQDALLFCFMHDLLRGMLGRGLMYKEPNLFSAV